MTAEEKSEYIRGFKEGEELFLRGLDEMKLDVKFDQRWLSIARTHIEEGFSALVRCVERPERLKLPGEECQTELPIPA